MNVELHMLAWSVVLGLAQIVVVVLFSTQQRGLAWNLGSRDAAAAPLTGVGGRMQRALHNFLETFPFFAAAVLAVLVTQHANAHTAIGAQLYFWARIAYVLLYALGVAYLRTLVWALSIAGLVLVLLPLL